MFGDFEAQRHWMEITVHLPALEWYKNTTNNDLMYWGLDYPPLTAFHSWLCGKVFQLLEPESMELFTSRGYWTPSFHSYMRASVLVVYALCFLPAAAAISRTLFRRESKTRQAWAFFFIAAQPALLLVDHGHFQYNCVSLGLALGAIAAILHDRDSLASVLFSLSLNYKQMNLYLAPPFFFFLLGKAIRERRPGLVIKCGISVIATFIVCWLPFLRSAEDAMRVAHRLFPFARGLFEDKVANFWCVSSLAVKWKQMFSIPTLAMFSLVATLVGLIPSSFLLFTRPSKQIFLWSMICSAFSFFLFSFQVHEKTVLVPLLPASLFVLERPGFAFQFSLSALFSIFPLLLKDGVAPAYFALYIAFACVFFKLLSSARDRLMLAAFLVPQLAVHAVQAFMSAPPHYPDLHTLLFALVSFLQFVALWATAHVQAFKLWKGQNHVKRD